MLSFAAVFPCHAWMRKMLVFVCPFASFLDPCACDTVRQDGIEDPGVQFRSRATQSTIYLQLTVAIARGKASSRRLRSKSRKLDGSPCLVGCVGSQSR